MQNTRPTRPRRHPVTIIFPTLERTLEMPRSVPKIHYKYAPCAHGRYFASARLADHISGVTCGACIQRYDKLGLRPIDNYGHIPLFDVVAGEPFPNGRGTHLVFRCPVCGRKNVHGRPGLQVGNGDGYRVSHCRCWGSYIIREREVAT